MKVDPDPLVPDTYVRSSKQVLIYQTKWGPRARKWPRPGVYGKSAGSVWRRVEFGYIAAATKNVHALDYETAVNLSRGTQYVPRDVLMLAMTGKLYEIHDTTGTIWSSWRMTVPNVQDVLEQLTNTPGAIIVRGGTFWEWITPGNASDVLTMVDGMPDWAPSQSGGGGGGGEAYGLVTPTAPVPADFSLEPDSAGTAVVTPFASFGFTMRQAATSGTHLSLFGRAVPAGTPWSVTIGVRMVAKPNLNFFNAGLYLRKSGNAKLLTIGGSMRAGSMPITVTKWNSATSFSADQYTGTTNGALVVQPLWYRVTWDGTNYTFQISVDGLSFETIQVMTTTSWLTAVADRVGFYVDAENADTTIGVTMTCFDYRT
jgi:hypothetical protein